MSSIDILSMIKRKNPFGFYCVILILNLSRLISLIQSLSRLISQMTLVTSLISKISRFLLLNERLCFPSLLSMLSEMRF